MKTHLEIAEELYKKYKETVVVAGYYYERMNQHAEDCQMVYAFLNHKFIIYDIDIANYKIELVYALNFYKQKGVIK